MFWGGSKQGLKVVLIKGSWYTGGGEAFFWVGGGQLVELNLFCKKYLVK